MSKKVNFIPADGRYLIRRATPDEMTKGEHGSSLVIPQVAQTEKFEGVIVAVPKRVHRLGLVTDPAYEEGMYVLYSKYGGTIENIDGEQLTLLHEEEILGEFPDKRVVTKPEVDHPMARSPTPLPGQPEDVIPDLVVRDPETGLFGHLNWTDKVERPRAPPADWDALNREANQQPALPPSPSGATVD